MAEEIKKKKKRRKKRQPGTWQTVWSEALLAKMDEAFARDLNNEQACAYCNIGHSTFYNYCQKHPEKKEHWEMLKNTPRIHAKFAVAEGVKTDPKFALEYLKLKSKDEFAPRSEIVISEVPTIIDDVVAVTDDNVEPVAEETQEKAAGSEDK